LAAVKPLSVQIERQIPIRGRKAHPAFFKHGVIRPDCIGASNTAGSEIFKPESIVFIGYSVTWLDVL